MVSRAVMPERRADQNLLDQHDECRPKRARVDVIGGAVQRQQHGGEHERECQPHPRRQVLLAEPRQKHQHGAGAREHQKKRRRQRRQEMTWSTPHLSSHPLVMCAAMRRKLACSRVGHERQRDQQREEDREDLRHEHQCRLLDLRQRLDQRDDDADDEADQHQRRRDNKERHDSLTRHVQHFRSGHLFVLSLLPPLPPLGGEGWGEGGLPQAAE